MYQRKVDVDMLNAVKSVLADVSSVSPSSERVQLLSSKRQPTHSLRRPAYYPHQPYVDTLYVLVTGPFDAIQLNEDHSFGLC